MTPDPGDRLIFLHIQKTAGVSVRAMLGEQLGWQDPVTVERLNASPGRAAAADLPAPARAAIVDHNALDIELYEFALDLFERRLSSAAAARATAPLPGHAAG